MVLGVFFGAPHLASNRGRPALHSIRSERLNASPDELNQTQTHHPTPSVPPPTTAADSDVKGANILVDNTGLVKLADFGASKRIEDLATVGASTIWGARIHYIISLLHII